MRIWSLHPRFLDAKGLVALWREALLAKHVLEGKTVGYRSHPQLDRFKRSPTPIDAINGYLAEVYREAVRRGYRFAEDKVYWDFAPATLRVTRGQLRFETNHLLEKLRTRDPARFGKLRHRKQLPAHPIFTEVNGPIEGWEKVRGVEG